MKLCLKGIMYFWHRFQNNANHIGNHQQGNKNFNEVAVLIGDGSVHDFISPTTNTLNRCHGLLALHDCLVLRALQHGFYLNICQAVMGLQAFERFFFFI